MEHGALVLLPLLSLELPMLQAFWLLARGIGEGPASPFQPIWKGRIRRKALPATMSAAPSPRQMALAEKDFLQLSEEGRTWLSTVRMFFVNDV